MTYEEWLKSVEFGLERRYKIKDFSVNDSEMLIIFDNNWYYAIDICELKEYWTTYGFEALCKNIEQELIYQIMNIRGE